MSRQHLVPSLVFLLGCVILAIGSNRPSNAQPDGVGVANNAQPAPAAANKIGKYQVSVATAQVVGHYAILCDTESGRTWFHRQGSGRWEAIEAPAQFKKD